MKERESDRKAKELEQEKLKERERDRKSKELEREKLMEEEEKERDIKGNRNSRTTRVTQWRKRRK